MFRNTLLTIALLLISITSHADSDTDGDGIYDYEDNCPLIANADQTDWDYDDQGNVCDATPNGDDDDDGIDDAVDNCPYDYNPEQTDSDKDKQGNACDATPYPVKMIISGSFKIKASAKGVKSITQQQKGKIYLYTNNTFSSNEDSDLGWGKYTYKGNKYVLRLNPDSVAASFEDEGLYLDDYSPLKVNIELNKNKNKANVKSAITLWLSNDDDEQAKVRLEITCKCSAKLIKNK